MTQNQLIPHLSHRQEIYYFPLVDIKTDYVLYNYRIIDSYYAGKSIINSGSYPGYHIVFDRDDVKLFQKDQ